MLEWQELKEKMDALDAEITTTVLGLQATQTVGIVRATYSGGRAVYDYKTPGLAADPTVIDLNTSSTEIVDWQGLAEALEPPPELLAGYTKIEKTTDWKAVCKESEIEPKVLSRSDPSVTLKILKEK